MSSNPANFLSSDSLTSTVDGYYFLIAPFTSAWHNFGAAFYGEPEAIEARTNNNAQLVLRNQKREPEKSLSEIKNEHFYSHLGAGILLSIPIVNLIPFAYLVIKTKENLIPKECVRVIMEDENFLSVKPSKTPLLLEAKKPDLPKETSFARITNLPSTSQEIEERIKKRSSGNIVSERMKAFQPEQKPNSDYFPIERTPSFSLKHLEKWQDEVTLKYFILFPEQSKESHIRKSKMNRNLPPNIGESEIVEKLLLTFPGHTLEPKLNNANQNLDALKNILKIKFPEEFDDLYFHSIYSNDAQIATNENVSEIVRRAIFSHENTSFIKLLERYSFSIYKGAIIIY